MKKTSAPRGERRSTRPPARTAAPHAPIRYSLVPARPQAHLYSVTVTVASPDPAGQAFTLPAWIPGSYMIREFAKHIVSLAAHARGKPVEVRKTDKAAWRCAPVKGPLTVTYEVYAWDLSVRAAHLDETHAFFNGTSVFLLPLGQERAPCEVELLPPPGEAFAEWRVATSMKQTQALARGSGQKRPGRRTSAGDVPPKTFGLYSAEDYDDLIDHPVEMGTFTHLSFEACGVPHHIAITGRHRCDLVRLAADLKTICEAQIRFFEPGTQRAPMDEYWFLVMAVGDGYGGLEHRASTALICSRDDLPLSSREGDTKITTGYRRFLGLASHEYFHTWNVKRIKPAAFVPYDLERENLTRQLWFFEGITSYYDDLFLSRTRLIEPLTYLEMLAETIGRVHAAPGRLRQSVADSSFDAWIKYYRQDENAPNAIVSYYQKGGLIGLALDITIRQATHSKRTLDDVMRLLWERHGKAGRGVPEGGIEAVAAEVAGTPLDAFFAHAVHGTEDLDLKSLLEYFAVDFTWRLSTAGPAHAKDAAPPTLGVKLSAETAHEARLAHVFEGSAAMAAGLSAGDAIVAIDGLRVTAGNFDRHIRSRRVGETLLVTAFRRDELMAFQVTLQAQAPQQCVLTLRDTPIEAKKRRNDWLWGEVEGA
ncbi:MAG: M61 family metallopeptidase [Betaproteobacteria bacterium]|nr:M61 family metallopeptidase [Betaproteobacteria bacterium]